MVDVWHEEHITFTFKTTQNRADIKDNECVHSRFLVFEANSLNSQEISLK